MNGTVVLPKVALLLIITLPHTHLQVYQELTKPPERRECNSVFTSLDMLDQLQMQAKEVQYHRIPMSDDTAPDEKVRMTPTIMH